MTLTRFGRTVLILVMNPSKSRIRVQHFSFSRRKEIKTRLKKYLWRLSFSFQVVFHILDPPPPLSPFRRRLLSAANAHAGGLFPNAHYQDPWLKKNTCQVDQTSNTSKLSLSCFPPTVSLSLCFFVCTSLARPYNSSSNLGQPRTLLFILQNQLYTLAGFELGSSE